MRDNCSCNFDTKSQEFIENKIRKLFLCWNEFKLEFRLLFRLLLDSGSWSQRFLDYSCSGAGSSLALRKFLKTKVKYKR